MEKNKKYDDSVIDAGKLNFIQNCLILRVEKHRNSPGGPPTPDLRITSAPSAVHTSTAYKYGALTDCATVAG